jgi:hypothetical protein
VSRATSVFAATTEAKREFHGWTEIGEKLSALAARGEWASMPELVSNKMLAEFCTQAESPSA